MCVYVYVCVFHMYPSLCMCVFPIGHLFEQPQRAVGGHHRPGGRKAAGQRGRRLSHEGADAAWARWYFNWILNSGYISFKGLKEKEGSGSGQSVG